MTQTAKTILLVEDDAIIGLSESQLLQREGYAVTHVLSGDDAIRAVRSAPLPIELILMDIDLGAGIDGTEAARIILQEADIPVVFLSSHTEPAVVDKAEKITSYGYVVKNSGETVLLASIKMAFRLFEMHQGIRDRDKVLEQANQQLHMINQELRSTNDRLEESNRKLAQSEKKIADNAAMLKASEQRLRTILENSQDGLYSHNYSTDRFDYVSPSMTRIFGYSVDELLSKAVAQLSDYTHPDDLPQVQQSMSRLMQSGGGSDYIEYRFKHQSGIYRWVGLLYTLVVSESGKPLYNIGSVRDITEQRKAGDELKDLNRLMVKAEQIAHLGSWEWDIVADSWHFSREWKHIHGIADDGLSMEEMFLLAYPGDHAIIQKSLGDALSGSRPFNLEHRIVRKDTGEIRWVHALGEVIFDAAHTPLKMNGVSQDITEHTNKEKALQESEARFRAIFDYATIGIILSDIDGMITFANPAALDMLGYTVEEIVGRSFTEFTDASFLAEELRMVEQLKNGTIDRYRMEKKYIKKNRSLIDISLSATVLRSDDGLPMSGLVFFEDITESKRLRDELQRLEWMLAHPADGRSPGGNGGDGLQPYGDLTVLNHSRLILNSAGADMLRDIARDYLDLLETSSAIYEKTGEYALGIFSSGWCRFMDLASRELCHTTDNEAALASGRWHCHESCWRDAARASMETGGPVDIACSGGIRLYAVPIRAQGEIIGSINFGYGDPPRDPEKLRELADRYQVDAEELRIKANAYETRPPFIIELAKKRLLASARLIGEIIERKKMEDDLKISEQRFRSAEKLAAIGNWHFNIAGDRITWSDGMYAIYGVDQGSFICTMDALLQLIHPDDRAYHGRVVETIINTGSANFSYRIIRPDGVQRHIQGMGELQRDRNGTAIALFGIVRDNTDFIRSQEALTQALQEKDILFRELQHRVKNNLTIMSSLLGHELQGLTDERSRKAFTDTQARLYAMSQLYETLSQSSDLDRLDLHRYVEKCARTVFEMNSGDRTVSTLYLQTDPMKIDMRRSVPVGLMLNELVVNAIKYACPPGTQGEIRVQLRKENEWASLTVSDNGPGLPDGFDLDTATSMGYTLVRMLARQINAALSIESEPGKGVSVQLRFMLLE